MMQAKMRMIDMHAHLCLSEEVELRAENGIITCFSAGTPDEWRGLRPYQEREEILASFGIHPWYADQFGVEECREYFDQCDFVGEIGMDSVWCEVPLLVQQKKLEQQLQLAADLRKPVILHTKGQEETIADMVRGFPGKVCVHWYSGPETEFEKFLRQDCYFTLGPDMASLCRKGAGLSQRMAWEIPIDRLFVETDGISAVAWARRVESVDVKEIPAVLRENMEYAAGVKGMPVVELAERMQENLREFLNRKLTL